MWAVEILDAVLPARLDAYGIRPRDPEGLAGIPAAPFLHGGFGHLMANTAPFLVLGALVAFEGRRAFWRTTAVVVLIGGLGTWLLGAPHSVVVGASGVVFGYFAYVLARAWWSRRLAHMGVAVLVLLLYGGLLLGVLPGTPGVSWQGHLAGAAAGVVAARLGHGRHRQPAASGPMLRR
jgi:membrane associated rhomboid family serine protease